MKSVFACLLAFSTMTLCAHGLGPHEVLVLANNRSVDSIEVAKAYSRLRFVPEENIIRLDLPWGGGAVPLSITHEEFTLNIWQPVAKIIENRGIGDHILAWAYSVDFPTTIKFNPDVSIQGLTFLRNRMPEHDKLAKGLYVSPLFAGPDNIKGNSMSSQTLDAYKAWLGADMPLPSMMLGFTGERGNTKEEVLKSLHNAAGSDETKPQGMVYFVTTEDIRSKCREWQYARVVAELNAHNVSAVVTNVFPDSGRQLIGLMCGTASIDVSATGANFLPGSMAEHLTSAAGMFNSGGQTKLTEWIKAGASASCGTITEPFCIWMKFPNARFFVHYAAGCTMIESFWQSIRCPLQILIVGDPLASPWKPKMGVTITGIEGDSISDKLTAGIEVSGDGALSYRRFMFLLDGKIVGNSRMIDVDTSSLLPGEHMLRAVAYRAGSVSCQAFCEKKIIVKR
ncbi:hypothetical protein C4588_01760 [Candidatus Parcubacteria bacterium]|nr:MAG: hypothetical protein C4588_01760 [Candidatus Parcubacteria bacterium]